jgi:hypothetical protein
VAPRIGPAHGAAGARAPPPAWTCGLYLAGALPPECMSSSGLRPESWIRRSGRKNQNVSPETFPVDRKEDLPAAMFRNQEGRKKPNEMDAENSATYAKREKQGKILW